MPTRPTSWARRCCSRATTAQWLQRSVELDPYLKSAYWAGAQALRRIGRDDEAATLPGRPFAPTSPRWLPPELASRSAVEASGEAH